MANLIGLMITLNGGAAYSIKVTYAEAESLMNKLRGDDKFIFGREPVPNGIDYCIRIANIQAMHTFDLSQLQQTPQSAQQPAKYNPWASSGFN